MMHFFVTGATGVLGGAIVIHLLQKTDSRVSLLIRDKPNQTAKDRMQKLLVSLDLQQHRDRIELYAGDITADFFGIHEEERKNAFASVTHIIHCAADINLGKELEKALIEADRSIQSLGQVIALAPQLQKIEYVSTVGILGKDPGPLKETPFHKSRDFHNSYEASKAKAEDLLFLNFSLKKWPITVHRPSMIVGDSETGHISSYQIFYYICDFISGMRTRGILPNLNGFQLDTIPVNHVAQMIVKSAWDKALIGQVIHHCSGQTSISLIDLQHLILKLYSEYGIKCFKIRQIPIGPLHTLVKLLRPLFQFRSLRNFRSLEHLLSYLRQRQQFENEMTKIWIGGSHPIPDPRSYLPRVIQHYLSRGHRFNSKK